MILVIIIFSALFFLPLVVADYYSTDPYGTDFDEIEDPTADDLLGVSDPTINDFQRLSSYEQREYLLIEYNTDFAADFVANSDFSEAEDRMIAEQYYSEDPTHINEDPDNFITYMNQEGIDITISGPVTDYDEKGTLYGNDQSINLNNFKNSPAADMYSIIVTDGGAIELLRKEASISTRFNGDVEVDKQGKFSLKEGYINAYAVKGAKQLEFDENGDIAAGKVTYYDGITFAEPTTLDTKNGGSTLHVEEAAILSVAPSTNLYIYGSATFADYGAVQGKLTISDISNENYFVVNNMLFTASGDNVELRFQDDPSQDPHVSYAQISEDTIVLNGASPSVFFNSRDFVAGTGEIHRADTVISPNSGTVTISRKNGRMSITGREMALQFGDLQSEDVALYMTKEGKLYKEVSIVDKRGISQLHYTESTSEAFYSQLGAELGISVPVDIIVEEGGGVAFSLENEYAALKDGTDKPTILGTHVQAAEIAFAYTQGDTESIQERIDTIAINLEKGVGISKKDQEFLVALYSGISTGGYVKAGPNAGNALNHYFTGNGEQLDVDSKMFEESRNTQEAMNEIEREIAKQQATGQTSGTIKSSSCGCVHKQVAIEVDGEDKIVDNTDGVITSGRETDPELYYTNHNFYLDAAWEQTADGTTKIVWSVDDFYDFKGFGGEEVIVIPVLGTDEEIQLPDGVARAMARNLDLAKPFNVHAEWETSVEE